MDSDSRKSWDERTASQRPRVASRRMTLRSSNGGIDGVQIGLFSRHGRLWPLISSPGVRRRNGRTSDTLFRVRRETYDCVP